VAVVCVKKNGARCAAVVVFAALACGLIHAQESSRSSILSVMDFGAVGDGTSDDTAAINAAMNACVTRAYPKNGCVLYFPSGIYITTGIVLRPFVHMKGDGWATSVIKLRPHTRADVVTLPVDAFNFSLHGLTLDGSSSRGGRGNCFSTGTTPLSPAEWNTSNKQTAPVNAQKWGHIEEVMFSNCSADGIHIHAYNYMLFFDNFYVYHNGVYGIYTEGTNSGFSNFEIEQNGTAGIHVANANNRFNSGEVIWNGWGNDKEAAVYVSGARNIMTAIETEDNYTNGFLDAGTNDEFIGCLSDSDGYVQKNPAASSRKKSGFLIQGTNGVFLGDKVTSYRGRLPDGNFTAEWPYRVENPHQSRIDISYDSTNKPPAVATDGPLMEAPAEGHIACVKSAGPPVVMGTCSSAVDSKGACRCN